MTKKTAGIRINRISSALDAGIAIEKLTIGSLQEAILNASEEAKQPHREDRHSFFLLEGGKVTVEIDFETFRIGPLSVVYMHPDQVHRILKLEKVTVSVLAIDNVNLNPEYLKLLEGLKPARPLFLGQSRFSLISDSISVCIKFSERKNEPLYHSLLKDSVNALVALVLSEYLNLRSPAQPVSRFNVIANNFKEKLEKNFTSIRSPAAYARKLNISSAWLNECVKKATGHSVSYHIQQRVVLEAKRLLYHSDKTVKEISADLGYDDYPYFSRLFTKASGYTPLAFRNKNHR